MSDCPYCNPKHPRPDPWLESQCVLRRPLLMVIPPGGIHLSCPCHPEGHHVHGPEIMCISPTTVSGSTNPIADSSYRPPDLDSTRFFCEYDSTKPFGTVTGDSIRSGWYNK